MNTRQSIKDIADIKIGYSFRTALDWQVSGDIFVLQANNISDSIIINEQDLGKIIFDDFKASSFVKQDDIIISSRGRFRSAVVKSEAKNILASSSVYILRLKNDRILAEYLAIYLNSRDGQKQIKSNSTGAGIITILKKDLEEIEILVPSLNIQKQIINLYNNNQKLQKLLAQKKELTNKIIEGTINNLINIK